MAEEPPVAVVEGPKGKAEIFELWLSGRLIEYRVTFNKLTETYANIGEAYIAAGEKVGTKTDPLTKEASRPVSALQPGVGGLSATMKEEG